MGKHSAIRTQEAILGSLLEQKVEYQEHLMEVLTDPVLTGFRQLYAGVAKARRAGGVLQAFQDDLGRVAEWNQVQIDQAYQDFFKATSCSYLYDLVRALLTVHLQIHMAAAAIQDGGRAPAPLRLRIPSAEAFLHRVYVATARGIWKKPYLFYEGLKPLEQQHNLSIAEAIVQKAIRTVVRGCLPMDQLIRQLGARAVAAAAAAEEAAAQPDAAEGEPGDEPEEDEEEPEDDPADDEAEPEEDEEEPEDDEEEPEDDEEEPEDDEEDPEDEPEDEPKDDKEEPEEPEDDEEDPDDEPEDDEQEPDDDEADPEDNKEEPLPKEDPEEEPIPPSEDASAEDNGESDTTGDTVLHDPTRYTSIYEEDEDEEGFDINLDSDSDAGAGASADIRTIIIDEPVRRKRDAFF